MAEVGVPPALEAAVESLREAVIAGRTDIVRRLLDACDSCDGGGKEERKQLINSHCAGNGGSFLHLAAKLGHGDIVRALLAGGGDPGIVDNNGDTPLQLAKTPAVTAVFTEDLLRATAQSDLGRVCQLLAGGLSVNSYDNAVSRNTPLHWAASFADTDTIHCLIARGANVDSINSDGATPLHDAVARCDASVVKALLQHGANPTLSRCSAGRHKGKTAQEMAQERGGEVLEALQEGAAQRGAHRTKTKASPLLIRPPDALDMRALAGSLESLNSIGISDSLSGISEQGYPRDRIPPHRTNMDVGVFSSKTSAARTFSVGESISEDPKVEPLIVNGHSDQELNGSEQLTEDKNLLSGEQLTENQHLLDEKKLGDKQQLSRGSLSQSPEHSTSSLDSSPNLEQVYAGLATRSRSAALPPSLVTSAALHLLWPPPRHLTQLGGAPWPVPPSLTIVLIPSNGVTIHSMCDVVMAHKAPLEGCGVTMMTCICGEDDEVSIPLGSVVCMVAPTVSPGPLHYSLTVTQQGVRIICGSLDSLHSALSTLCQLIRVYALNSRAEETRPQTEDASQLTRKISEPALSLTKPPSFSRSQSDGGVLTTDAALGDKNLRDSGDRSHGAVVHIESLVIRDYPDIKHRAFMLDAAPLARVPNPTMMYSIVDSLASLKMNQLHLMMRILPLINYSTNSALTNHQSSNTLSDDSNSAGLTNGHCDNATNEGINKITNSYHCPLPYSASELLALSRYCRDRGVALIPAFDLDPSYMVGQDAPHSVIEMAAVVSSSLRYFPDATFVSIGPSLTSVFASSSVTAPTALNPWKNLGLSERSTLIVCANVFQSHGLDYLSHRVPATALLMEYGFLADHDFSAGHESAFLEGRLHALCCGTAAWSSLAGFPEAGLSNVYKGCVNNDPISRSLSSCCAVIAHWSTPASLTPLVFMWPSLIVSAGLSWNSQTHWDYVNSSIGTLIDVHLVNVIDAGFGSALVELGRCETWLTREMRNQKNSDMSNLPPASTGPGSTLHQLLADPDGVLLENLSTEKFASVLRHIKRSIRAIANNRVVFSSWPLMPVAAAELNLSADLMMTACRLGRALVTIGSNPRSNLGMAVVNPGLAHLPATIRTDVANRLLSLRESYSILWLHGYQPPGLQASLLLLSSLLTRLLPHTNYIQDL